MGHGNVRATIPVGPEIVSEAVSVAIVRAPANPGHFALYLYVHGGSPVSAQIALPAQLLATPTTANINIAVPLVAGLPNGPNISVERLHATLGPRGLTYYEHLHGKTIAYHPAGILLPNTCPHKGFPFAATLAFEDGTHTTTTTTIPCKPAHHQRATPGKRTARRKPDAPDPAQTLNQPEPAGGCPVVHSAASSHSNPIRSDTSSRQPLQLMPASRHHRALRRAHRPSRAPRASAFGVQYWD